MKYSHHPLPASYIDVLSTNNFFDLVIIGKDPFPTAPLGVPFCKSSWKEQLKDNNSGFHVLKSLGIDLELAQYFYSVPLGLFYSLATQGIIFLNCSYHFLDNDTIPKKDHIYIDMALLLNEPIIKNSKNILLCGQAKIIEEKINMKSSHKVIHPDIQNRGLKEAEWRKWWDKNAIKTTFNLNITC